MIRASLCPLALRRLPFSCRRVFTGLPPHSTELPGSGGAPKAKAIPLTAKRLVAAPLSHSPAPTNAPKPSALPIKLALSKINSQYPDVYAKLLIHNFPFTVVRTDLIITHRMRDVQVGDVIELDEIREVGSRDYKLRGLPLLPKGAVKVRATVMEHTHGAKKRARMRQQRKGRRALRTIKPRITTLRIQDIVISTDAATPQQ